MTKRFSSLIRGLGVALLGVALASCASQQSSRPSTAGAVPRAQPAPVLIPAQNINGADPYQYPRDMPQIVAQSWILIDARSGETLAYKNPDQRRAVASTQKLITAMLVTEHGGIDEAVVVQPGDTRVEPTKLGIRSGDQYTKRQLLTAMMVKSCNDAALCLGRATSGSVSAFASEMNRKAREMGMTSSHFMNPHGLNEPGQYSTARDMSRAAFRAYRNNTLRQMMMMRHYAFRHSDGRVSMLDATNKLLGQTPYVNGMKTGYTAAAGRCLVTSGSLPSGRELILVQLGSNTRSIFRDAATVFNWANREFPARGPAFASIR